MLGVLIGLAVAAAVFGLFYGIMRCFCRPKRAKLCALVLVLIAGLVVTPALRSAQIKAQRTSANCHLKQIGLALTLYAGDHQNILPLSLHDKGLKEYLGSESVLADPETGDQFIYIGAGHVWMSDTNEVIAYSPHDSGGNGRNVLFNDGHVAWLSCAKFTEALKDSGHGTTDR